jgi:hypothetical protein
MPPRAFLLAACLLAAAMPAARADTLRCGQRLVSLGDLVAQVLDSCGAPAHRNLIPPALAPNGLPREGAVTVEDWTYGPLNGMRHYLRFIDGRLVSIHSERG